MEKKTCWCGSYHPKEKMEQFCGQWFCCAACKIDWSARYLDTFTSVTEKTGVLGAP